MYMQVAAKMNYNIISNTTFTVSNIMGPLNEMMFAGNPITYIRPTSTGLPQVRLFIFNCLIFFLIDFRFPCNYFSGHVCPHGELHG